jgi:hypothetical protein
VDGSEVAEGVTVYEIAMVGSCVVATTDAVGVNESVGDTVCDLMLLEYVDGVGVCVGLLDGVDVSEVVGENVGLSDGESVVVSPCDEAAAVDARVACGEVLKLHVHVSVREGEYDGE